MDFKHEIIGLKDQGDKNQVDENVSNHGTPYNRAYNTAAFKHKQ